MTGSTFQGVASIQPPTKNGRNSTSLPKFSERNNFPRHLQTSTSGFLLQPKQMNKTNFLTTLVFFLFPNPTLFHTFTYLHFPTNALYLAPTGKVKNIFLSQKTSLIAHTKSLRQSLVDIW